MPAFKQACPPAAHLRVDAPEGAGLSSRNDPAQRNRERELRGDTVIFGCPRVTMVVVLSGDRGLGSLCPPTSEHCADGEGRRRLPDGGR
jgi:hypothetical protein